MWLLCDTSGVGERSGVLLTGSPFGHHPRLSMVCPLQGQWVRAGRFLFSLPLDLSTGSPFGYHPRLRLVCPRWGQWVDNELFLLLPRNKTLWRSVFSLSCGLICRAQKYNKGVS